MHSYSELLQICRQKANLTQKELVEQLSQFSNDFIDLNTVTLSRWERGVASPSFQRKKTLFHYLYQQGFLDDKECMHYFEESFQDLKQPLALQLDHKYDGLIGNLPSFKVSAEKYLCIPMKRYTDEKLRYTLDIEKANHSRDDYILKHSRLKEWCNFESSFCLGCELDGEHIGHTVMLKVSTETATAVIHHQKSIFSLTKDDLLSSDEKGTYIIHSLYGINAEIMAMLTIRTLLFILENRNKIENIATFITRKDNLKLMHLFGHRVIKKGSDSDGNYIWYTTLTPPEEILFSDMVIKMISQ